MRPAGRAGQGPGVTMPSANPTLGQGNQEGQSTTGAKASQSFGVVPGDGNPLRRQDSNLNHWNQNPRCCRYTTADRMGNHLMLRASGVLAHGAVCRGDNGG